ADLAAEGFDFCGSLLALEIGQCAGEHEGFAGERAEGRRGIVESGVEIQIGLAEAIDELAVAGVAVPLDDAARDDFADVLNLGELRFAGGEEVVEIGESLAERLGDTGTDVEDAEAKEEAPHVARFAGLDAVEEILRGFL